MSNDNARVKDLYNTKNSELTPDELKLKEILIHYMVFDGTISEAEAWNKLWGPEA